MLDSAESADNTNYRLPALILQISGANVPPFQVELIDSARTIGRLANCDIQLDSVRVSRRHAELIPQPGGWLLRDLDSRNGTRLNGRAIKEEPIGVGDVIQIGEFELAVHPKAATQMAGDNLTTTLWALEEKNPRPFTTLATAPPPRLDALLLSLVSELSKRLVEIGDECKRMTYLCETLTRSEMRCTSAVVLRVMRDAMAAPPMLMCAFQLRDPAGAAPTVSRPVVEAVVMSERPILAGGSGASGLTINFSSQELGVVAFIACPLHSDVLHCDVLYLTVPHDCGTVDWLALAALAAEQYKKAELQLDARRNIEANAALQRDVMKARKMQMSLVPRNPEARGLEVAIGFEPCHFIGGDYVNVLPTPEDRVFLAIADVSGKGLPAAMVASGVHSIVHAAIRSGFSPRQMAEGLNRYLLESMDRQSFVTMLGVLFDPDTGKIEVFNAGHPPLVIIDQKGNLRELPFGHNPPLGVVPTEIKIDSAELGPGDLMAVYTDGLSELFNADGKLLGVEGVESMLVNLYVAHPAAPLSDLRAALDERLSAILGSRAATDDRTFLLARRK